MNKLKYNQPGGVPINVDDLQWQIDEIITGFSAVAGSLIHPPTATYILYGIKDTGANITAGFIFYQGEVYFHPAQVKPSFNPDTHMLVIDVVTEDDTTSNSEFADTVVRPTRSSRYARTIAVEFSAVMSYIIAPPSYEVMPFQRLPLWSVASNAPSETPNLSGLVYRRDREGFITIKGNLNHGQGEFFKYYTPFLPGQSGPNLIDHILPGYRVAGDGTVVGAITEIEIVGGNYAVFNYTPPNTSAVIPLVNPIVYRPGEFI